jgi:DNA topoisomerase-1
VYFTYKGKSNVRQRQVSGASDIVRLARRLGKTPGRRLFRFLSGAEWRDLTAADVNEYLRRRVGRFSAKDFRTWGGTLRAAIVLAELGPAPTPTVARRNVALAMRLVAAELGNTPTVCRNSYVHPMVIARYIDAGETIVLPNARGAGATARRSAEERGLIAFLERHFPERRRARAATPRAARSRGARVPERRATA